MLGCVPLGWSRSGSMIQDHSDHGASKEPTNPLWARIPGFLWCTMIRVILDHWSWSGSSQRNAPLITPLVMSYGNARQPCKRLTSWLLQQIYLVLIEYMNTLSIIKTITCSWRRSDNLCRRPEKEIHVLSIDLLSLWTKQFTQSSL